MDKNINLWLHDMLTAVDEIFEFLPEPRNYLEFKIVAWIEIHQEELLANWELAVNGKPIFRIKGGGK